jgi:hypothetical protein
MAATTVREQCSFAQLHLKKISYAYSTAESDHRL